MNFEELLKLAKKSSKEIILNNKSSYGKVAVACITSKNNIYTGLCLKTTCNVGFCAETAAIAKMLDNNDTKIAKLVAVYNGNEIISPCGKCREQIYQLNHDNLDCEILLSDRIVKLKELLPEI